MENNIQIDSAKTLALLVKENSCVIIKISASWCGPCKDNNFKKAYDELKFFYKNYSNVKFIDLDIDEHEYILEDKNYYDIDINAVPTFLISQNGSFIKKIEGSGQLYEINQLILNILNLR